MNKNWDAGAGLFENNTPVISSNKTRLQYAVVLALFFFLLVWPVILSHSTRQDKTGAEGDERLFHYPTILKMEKAWPHPDLNDVGGAQMTPTFHLLMAGVMHYGNLNLTGLRLVNSFIGLALILAVFWYTSRLTDALTAFALSIPFLFSPFMLSCAMWLMTLDLNFCLVVIALAGAAMFPPTTSRAIGNGLAAMGATAVRQISIWLIAPLLVAALWQWLQKRFPQLAPLDDREPPASSRLLFNACIVVALPLAALLFYVIQWHGLMSPSAKLQGAHNHFTIIPIALAQAGFCCLFLVPAVLETPLLRHLLDRRVWAGAVFFVVLAALPRSAQPNDPSGALHELSRTPALFNRVLLLLPPAAIAGAGLTALFLEASRRGQMRAATIIIIGFFSWLAAHTTPVYALRQYCDIIMVMVLWLAALCVPAGPRKLRFWVCTGSLALIQLAMVVWQIYLPVLGGK